MDLEQGIAEYSNTEIKLGHWEDLKQTDIILITASVPEMNVQSRIEYLSSNLEIIKSVCSNIKKYSSNSIIINATNPVDIINLAIWKFTNFDRNKIIGFSRNDTLRFRWAIARVLGINIKDVSAICIGEHGEKQVPLFSKIEIAGRRYELTEEEKNRVNYEINNWFLKYQSLKSGRTSGWTSSLGLSEVIKCIVTSSETIVPCSAILEGEYGLYDVSIGVPTKLGINGIREIIELPLNEEEYYKFVDAAQKVQGLFNEYSHLHK
jgi:malate dehydrogenase